MMRCKLFATAYAVANIFQLLMFIFRLLADAHILGVVHCLDHLLPLPYLVRDTSMIIAICLLIVCRTSAIVQLSQTLVNHKR